MGKNNRRKRKSSPSRKANATKRHHAIQVDSLEEGEIVGSGRLVRSYLVLLLVLFLQGSDNNRVLEGFYEQDLTNGGPTVAAINGESNRFGQELIQRLTDTMRQERLSFIYDEQAFKVMSLLLSVLLPHNSEKSPLFHCCTGTRELALDVIVMVVNILLDISEIHCDDCSQRMNRLNNIQGGASIQSLMNCMTRNSSISRVFGYVLAKVLPLMCKKIDEDPVLSVRLKCASILKRIVSYATSSEAYETSVDDTWYKKPSHRPSKRHILPPLEGLAGMSCFLVMAIRIMEKLMILGFSKLEPPGKKNVNNAVTYKRAQRGAKSWGCEQDLIMKETVARTLFSNTVLLSKPYKARSDSIYSWDSGGSAWAHATRSYRPAKDREYVNKLTNIATSYSSFCQGIQSLFTILTNRTENGSPYTPLPGWCLRLSNKSYGPFKLRSSLMVICSYMMSVPILDDIIRFIHLHVNPFLLNSTPGQCVLALYMIGLQFTSDSVKGGVLKRVLPYVFNSTLANIWVVCQGLLQAPLHDDAAYKEVLKICTTSSIIRRAVEHVYMRDYTKSQSGRMMCYVELEKILEIVLDLVVNFKVAANSECPHPSEWVPAEYSRQLVTSIRKFDKTILKLPTFINIPSEALVSFVFLKEALTRLKLVYKYKWGSVMSEVDVFLDNSVKYTRPIKPLETINTE